MKITGKGHFTQFPSLTSGTVKSCRLEIISVTGKSISSPTGEGFKGLNRPSGFLLAIGEQASVFPLFCCCVDVVTSPWPACLSCAHRGQNCCSRHPGTAARGRGVGYTGCSGFHDPRTGSLQQTAAAVRLHPQLGGAAATVQPG